MFAWLVLPALAMSAAAVAPKVGVAPPNAALVREVGGAAWDVVPPEEMQQHVDAASSLGITCADASDAACFARIGAFAKIPFVIVVTSSAGEVSASLVDTATSKPTVLRAALPPDPAQHALTKHALLAALLLNAPMTASIVVDSEPSVSLTVDGAATPASMNVAPGHHVIVVTASDGRTASADVDAYAGANAHVSIALPSTASVSEPAATGSVSPIAFGVLVGAGASAVVAGGAWAGALVVTPDPARRDQYTAREFNDAASTGQTLGVVAAVGGVLALAAGVAGGVLLLLE